MITIIQISPVDNPQTKGSQPNGDYNPGIKDNSGSK